MQTSPPRGWKSGELDPAPSTAWSRANPTEYVKEELRFQRPGRNLLAFGRQEPVEYRQENVEVLPRSDMMQQVMRPPGVGHPSSVVYAQVDLYPHYDVGQKRGSDTCQNPQVEQLIENNEQ